MARSHPPHRSVFPWLLVVLFIVVFGIRIALSLQTETFSGSEAYFTMRQIDAIKEQGLPLYNDPLSFGGREYLFSPLFYYLTTFFSVLFSPWIVGKVLLNLIAASLLIFIYLITKKITGDEQSAMFSAFVGSFIPVFFVTTLNTFSIISFVFPLFFSLVYLYVMIETHRATLLFMGLFFLLALTNALGVVFIVSWLIYLILLKVNDLAASRAEIEIGIFSIVLFLWTHLIIYKNAFLEHGFAVIWQNVPHTLFVTAFKNLTLASALYLIGLIPLLYGVYAIFHHTFYNYQNKKILFLTAGTLATFILLLLKFIKIEVGLIMLGTIMSILFSEFYLHIFEYVRTTRFANYKKIITVCLFFVVVSSSVFPSIMYARRSVQEAVSPAELRAHEWLRDNAAHDAVVLSSAQEGHLVTGIAKRKNVLDTNFLFVKNSNTIFDDVTTIYTTRYETEAIKLLGQYGVDYILVSERLKRELPLNIGFLKDERCFRNVFSNSDVKIYESKCKLR